MHSIRNRRASPGALRVNYVTAPTLASKLHTRKLIRVIFVTELQAFLHSVIGVANVIDTFKGAALLEIPSVGQAAIIEVIIAVGKGSGDHAGGGASEVLAAAVDVSAESETVRVGKIDVVDLEVVVV